MTRTRARQLAGAVLLLGLAAAVLAPWLAPQDPCDLAALDLMESGLPPVWLEGGVPAHLLGTDDQGRDLLSALLYGTRLSLAVCALAVGLSLLLGVGIGLLAAQAGGWIDALLMRLCDVMLSFPPLLVAMLTAGIGRLLWPQAGVVLDFGVVVLAIGLTGWVPHARTVRAAAGVELGREHVLAARVIGVAPWRILRRHVLPHVLAPVRVLATLQVGSAVLTEATLSFLGLGAPPTVPTLGTLVRTGHDHLLSGQWWLVACPGAVLVLLVLAAQALGDALQGETGRDA